MALIQQSLLMIEASPGSEATLENIESWSTFQPDFGLGGERTEDPSFPDCRQIKLDFSAFPAHFGTTCEPMISLAKLKSRDFQASFLSMFFPQIDGNSPEISAGKVHEGITFQLNCSDWPDKETASPLDHFAKLFILGWPLR